VRFLAVLGAFGADFDAFLRHTFGLILGSFRVS